MHTQVNVIENLYKLRKSVKGEYRTGMGWVHAGRRVVINYTRELHFYNYVWLYIFSFI